MRLRYTCPSCEKQATFDTKDAQVLTTLLESEGGGGGSVYVVKCPHCGAQNEIPAKQDKP